MWNEEEIKNNIVVPFLVDCGFHPSELSYETKFKIALGRGRFDINGRECAEANGRLDILCKRDNEHLCVIELKAEGVELSDDDRIQGLTYARLLEPMAPFVIVTNGKDTKVYSSITGIEVNRKPDKNSWTISGVKEEIEIRFEALYQFFGMSIENLLYFCNSHNELEYKSFIANDSDSVSNQLQKKYIQALYVNRQTAENEFKAFIEQQRHCVFPLIGDSGTGKTNLMIYLSQFYAASHPVLFYSGTLLSGSIFKRIQRDFNLYFSAEDSEIGLFKKISRLLKKLGKPLILFIDAIDEWDAEDKNNQLNELGKICDDLGIKLCISCKTDTWGIFKSRRGISMPIGQHLFPSSFLGIFTPTEADTALSHYANYFGIVVKGTVMDQELRNPFYLRVVSEVSHSKSKPLLESASVKETYRHYINSKIVNMDSPDSTNSFLLAIAELLLERGTAQAPEDDIKQKLHMRGTESLPFDLFSYNLLYRYVDLDGRSIIGFYFSGIRDYITAIKLLQLDRHQGNAHVALLKEKLACGYIAQSAIFWFFKTGNVSTKYDILRACIAFDTDTDACLTPKLLGNVKEPQDNFFTHKYYSLITEHLKFLFISYRSSSTRLDEILDVIEKLKSDEQTETLLVDLFEIIADGSEGSICAHRLAKLLRMYDTVTNTSRLLALVLNQSFDGYVRRYIVESLNDRSGFDRRNIFLKLSTDVDVNVRHWVGAWYPSIEDCSLRNSLLERLDNENSELACTTIRYLFHSSLPDTPIRLTEMLSCGNYDDELEGWMYRCVANLQHMDAVPLLIERLENRKSTRLREQLVISLGELRAVEATPILFDMLVDINESNKILIHWISDSLSQIGKINIEYLQEIAIDQTNLLAAETALRVLMQIDSAISVNLIKTFIENKNVQDNAKISLLSQWEGEKNSEQIDFLYSLVNRNDFISPVALELLINDEKDIERLTLVIKEIAPVINEPLSGRHVLFKNKGSITRLSESLRMWLHHQLLNGGWSLASLKTILILLAYIGESSSVEVLRTVKQAVIETTDNNYYDQIEYAILSSKATYSILHI